MTAGQFKRWGDVGVCQMIEIIDIKGVLALQWHRSSYMRRVNQALWTVKEVLR
jgi:hypothetical protein